MTADTSAALFEALHTLIAPGNRVRVPPYVESAQFRVLFKVRPDPAARSCGKGLNHRNTPMFYALPSDYGRAFRVAHLQADGGACYDVNLGADSPSCSCAGNTYRPNQPCKHFECAAGAPGTREAKCFPTTAVADGPLLIAHP